MRLSRRDSRADIGNYSMSGNGAISKSQRDLSETHNVGGKTREWIVRAEDCPALRWYHIRHVGVADAAEPYRMGRTNLSGAYFLGCFGGEGRILLDGKWHSF